MTLHSKNVQLRGNSSPTPPKIAAPNTGALQPHVTRTWPPRQNAVLCIDRDTAARSILQSALPGYEIVFASGAYEALRNINVRAFDLYVLDYWLVDWSGVSLCRHIRKADPHVPICFCTSMAQLEHRQRAERAGASGYFLKPINRGFLNDEISLMLQLKRQCNEAARLAALASIQQELSRRLAALPSGTSYGDVQTGLKRTVQTKARNVFLEANGTLAGFLRVWELLWADAWRGYS